MLRRDFREKNLPRVMIKIGENSATLEKTVAIVLGNAGEKMLRRDFREKNLPHAMIKIGENSATLEKTVAIVLGNAGEKNVEA